LPAGGSGGGGNHAARRAFVKKSSKEEDEEEEEGEEESVITARTEQSALTLAIFAVTFDKSLRYWKRRRGKGEKVDRRARAGREGGKEGGKGREIRREEEGRIPCRGYSRKRGYANRFE